MTIVQKLRKEYCGFTEIQAAKCEMLLLWFVTVSPNLKSISEDGELGFCKRYWWLFREYALFYTWGPFYRDHGFVGIRGFDKIWVGAMLSELKV